MFRSARWKSEKNRIKVVFRLKFHTTQAFQFNAEGLTLFLVPGDLGKPTARSEKATVTDGQCRWEIPVYETVKFIKDAKTGKVNQRIYHLIVSTTGSIKAGLVGETSIDFADYADATKTCNVSLPLQNSNSKALLHISIQRQLEFDDPQKEVDEPEPENLEKMSHGKDLKSHLSIVDNADEARQSESREEGPFSKAARFAELRRRASIESDSTMSSSESVIEPNTPEEVAAKSLIHHSSKRVHQSSKKLFEDPPRISESEWSGSSDHGDSSNSSNTRNSSGEDEIEKLKTEVAGLTRQADLSELELQSLRKQIVKETKRSQDLVKEVNILKQERDSLKEDCEKHKVTDEKNGEVKMRNRLQFEGRDPWVLLEETREELDYEKDRNFNIRLQLQKTQEANSELILAIQDLEAMLEEKSKEGADNVEESRRKSCRSETDEDEDQKALMDLVKGHVDDKDTNVLEQKITDLYNEIEIYKRDKDELEIQMEQIALDYEILKQENHDISYKLEQSQLQEQLKMQYECSSSLVNVTELENQIEMLEAELKKQSEEYSESLNRIKEVETQMEVLEEELEKQGLVFEADIDEVTKSKVEQEQRAIKAEEDLRKTRLKNASVAEKIQDEFKRLSEQMDSMFTSNEQMAMKAMKEANELRLQKHQLEECLKNANDKIKELSEKLRFKTSEMVRMLESLDEKSNGIEKQKRHEEDTTAEITMLKEEIENLKKDKNSLILQEENLRVELEETRESVMEAEASLQRKNTDLENTIASMRKESEDLAEELHQMKLNKDDITAEITMLKEEIENLRKDKNNLISQAENLRVELEETRESVMETEASLQRKNTNLENTIASMMKESEDLAEELQQIKLIKEEKEEAVTHLQTELETVKAQCDDLKRSLAENESEMEKEKKQVREVKAELKKKEDAMASLEKKIMEGKVKIAINNLTKTAQRNNNNKGSQVGAKEVPIMKERIKLLEGQIKLKETALEASSNMFIEKEKNLKNRIEELETQLDQESKEKEEIRVLEAEMASLRESNESMEMELKEMQERYSESVMEAEASLQIKNTNLQQMKLIKEEKEEVITQLQTELENVKAQCDDLKRCLSENDSEMEKHKKQVTEVKAELKKKEDAMASLEKKLKESKIEISNLTKTAQRNNDNNIGAKEVPVMKERIKLLEGQIKLKESALEGSSNMFIEKEKNLKNRVEELETKLDQEVTRNEEIRVLVAEMASLRESNESMEMELKEMQERYSEVSLRFAEVEGERQQLVMTVRNLKNRR